MSKGVRKALVFYGRLELQMNYPGQKVGEIYLKKKWSRTGHYLQMGTGAVFSEETMSYVGADGRRIGYP